MIARARIPFAAAILGLLLGAAAPARAQRAPGAGEPAVDAASPGETPAIELIQEPAAPVPPALDPETPPRAAPVVVHRARRGLVVAGGIVWGATYTASAFAGFFAAASGAAEPCSNCGSQGLALTVPVAGPLLTWWMTPAQERGSPAIWAAWSGLQAVGAAMLIIGIVGHDEVVWRPLDGGPAVSVIPTLTPQSGALALNVSW